MGQIGPKTYQLYKVIELDPNGTNPGLFQRQNELTSDLKKVPDLSHLGTIWPTLGPNLTTLGSGTFSFN